MIPTLVVLMSIAAPDSPGTVSADDSPLSMPLARLARNPASETRLARRIEGSPERFNPGLVGGSGWERNPTFGGEPFEPHRQHPHPGLPPMAGNRLKIGYSYRLEHWLKGSNPLDRVGWSGPAK